MGRRSGSRAAILTLVLSLVSAAAAAAASPLVVEHRARVTLDPRRHTIAVWDTLAAAAGLPDSLIVNGGMALVCFGDPAAPTPAGRRPAVEVPPDTAAGCGRVVSVSRDLAPLAPAGAAWPPRSLVLNGSGTFLESTEGVVFSRENVGREIQATISEEGVYLAAEAHWLPTFSGALGACRLTIETPVGCEPLTNGVCLSREVRGDTLITVWEEKSPVDGVALVAGRYVVREDRAADVALSVWLLQDDPALAATYLERTKAYLAMYDEMIGPYPFGKFATVENWFPTGYGFPSWTLLGGAVMRLPFIPFTSFGHEVCHNWWGNSVYVAEAGGNWCEGLTTWCADYHAKELESDAAAREYRRNLLKDYAAYVRDRAKDMPLREFKERHSGATRAIGYGKAMMVFHMLDRTIGREAFLRALREVYAARKFQPASWDDFLAAFSAAGGRDFGDFGEQWLARTGAPILTLERVARAGDKVRFTLSQGAPPYTLDVPVVVTAPGGTRETTVRLDRMAQTYEVEGAGATLVAVDPDCHLFRRLHPLEIEPTISQVLASETPLFILPDAAEPELEAARAFARAFAELETPMMIGGGRPPVDVRPGASLAKVLINPRPEPLEARLAGAPQGRLTLNGDLAFLDGRRFSLKDHDLVFAATDPNDPAVTDLVVICRDPGRLPGLAGRVGHYGKYSYLVFPAVRGETVKGNWPLSASPLTARLAPVP